MKGAEGERNSVQSKWILWNMFIYFEKKRKFFPDFIQKREKKKMVWAACYAPLIMAFIAMFSDMFNDLLKRLKAMTEKKRGDINIPKMESSSEEKQSDQESESSNETTGDDDDDD